jgi:phage-related protein
MKRIEFIVTDNGKSPVIDFIDSLPEKTQAKTYATFKIVQDSLIVSEKYFKKLSGVGLYEVRVFHNKMKYRYLSFFYERSIIIVAHGFVKDTAKTPAKEISIAIDRKNKFLAEKKGLN